MWLINKEKPPKMRIKEGGGDGGSEVRPIYDGAQRQLQAAPNSLIREMRLTDPKMFTKWMSSEIFAKLLSIGPLITKKL